MKLLVLALLAAFSSGSLAETPSYVPPNGFVYDAATAIKIAEAVLVPIYGSLHIEGKKPLRATFRDGVWTVKGTLKQG
jgi:hypothetical protein